MSATRHPRLGRNRWARRWGHEPLEVQLWLNRLRGREVTPGWPKPGASKEARLRRIWGE
ncbi:MAG: hypothetical protein JWR10_962 [Rubritepida sp.]|nr:hypothetical protein [Rubritepida sp.]